MKHVIMAACLVLAGPAWALAQDVEGSKDHPMFSRFPNYFISEYEQQDFGAHEFPTKDGERRVEGKYWRITYTIKEGARKGGPIEIARNYTNLMTKRGGMRLVEEMDTYGGFTSATMKSGNTTLWLQIDSAGGGEYYTLTIVEEGAVTQQVEFTAAELAAALAAKGSIALRGIQFDTGKATITAGSADTLAQVGELLKSDAALKLEIQGHTDNVGAKAANLKLSQDRAAAVKAYLVANFGIAADRLTTAGFGDAKPVADNASEDGRAQNRRVELVKK